jgi:hypothetical protein
MSCNFFTDAITFISFSQFNDLRQYISKLHLKVRLGPPQLPNFASLLLLQDLKEIMQSRQTASVH